MVVIGGRTNNVGESVALDVYDTETSEWFRFPSIQRFRHAYVNVDTLIYVHGGFEHDTPNIPTDRIDKIDTIKLFVGHE
jgi:hypothetical protein